MSGLAESQKGNNRRPVQLEDYRRPVRLEDSTTGNEPPPEPNLVEKEQRAWEAIAIANVPIPEFANMPLPEQDWEETDEDDDRLASGEEDAQSAYKRRRIDRVDSGTGNHAPEEAEMKMELVEDAAAGNEPRGEAERVDVRELIEPLGEAARVPSEVVGAEDREQIIREAEVLASIRLPM